MPRNLAPRRWKSLVWTTAALGVFAPSALAQVAGPSHQLPDMQSQMAGTRLWTVQAEGGEGGEAGALVGLSPDVGYLGQLAIVEGHLLAALDLYRKGQVDDAIGLSYHPEAEMMDAVRESLLAHGAEDITPAMTAFSQRMEANAPVPEVEAALGEVRAAITAAAAPMASDLRTRLDAMVVLLRAAASEYAESTKSGTVEDVMAFHEAHAFVETARLWLSKIARQDAAKAAADKSIAALDAAAAEAFGDMAAATLQARDPAILAAVAARVELYVSQVH